jgi:ElaB/YqjD/DUF883 family membrane-anchored ribosome-binding protein
MAIANQPHVGNPDRGTQTHPPESSATGALQKVKDQAKEVVDSATEMAGQAKDKVQELASNVATQVKGKTQEIATATAEKAEDLGKELTNLARRYPIQALLVGFAVGLVLGRVSRM